VYKEVRWFLFVAGVVERRLEERGAIAAGGSVTVGSRRDTGGLHRDGKTAGSSR
jgi:hypothetical protein